MNPIEPIALSTVPLLFSPDYDANAITLMESKNAAGFAYRSVFGTVIYIFAVARIDIGFAVTLLARTITSMILFIASLDTYE